MESSECLGHGIHAFFMNSQRFLYPSHFDQRRTEGNVGVGNADFHGFVQSFEVGVGQHRAEVVNYGFPVMHSLFETLQLDIGAGEHGLVLSPDVTPNLVVLLHFLGNLFVNFSGFFEFIGVVQLSRFREYWDHVFLILGRESE